MPTRRPDDDYNDYDDRPRRPSDDLDERAEDGPRRRRRDSDDPPAKKGGGGRILMILLLVGGGGVVLCCGGCGVLLYLAAKSTVTVLDASRTKNAEGGTATATVNVRMNGDSPGGLVRGDYYFMFKSGDRTSVHNVGLMGKGGNEFKQTFTTPELAAERGPVEFWVERRDRETVVPVSPVHHIP